MAEDDVAGVLGEQIAYYRARAGEYDRTAPPRDADGFPELVAALHRFAPRGRVLELAAGTGQWTAELVSYSAELTVLDASSEMLAINRNRIDRPDVEFMVADVFDWHPPRRYDVVFFSAWLSHVPPQRFGQFWRLVDECLADGGRVFVVDELPAVAALEKSLPDSVTPVVERRLTSGARFRTVKVFRTPHQLRERLAALGWSADVQEVSWRFFYATITRTSQNRA